MNPVGWFEIPVTDMERARRFYGSLFGVTFEQLGLGPLRMALFPRDGDAKGSAGALVHGPGYTPSELGTIVYFTAPDIDGTVAKAAELGGTVIRGKTDIGEYGYVAHILDTEGNLIALHRTKT